MVFPSRGCQTCKSRRVKCDGGEPICDRCQKASRSCTWDPGYQAKGLPFKSENAFAEGQPRRPRRVREPSPEPILIVDPSPSSVRAVLTNTTECRSFHYWMENFLFRFNDLPEIGHEYGDYVVSHWSRARPDSSLHLAVSALTQAVFGQVMNIHEAIEDADRAYSQSIMKTHEEMKEPSNESIDHLLVATMVMETYENIMYGEKRYYSRDSFSSKADEVGSRLWKNVNHHKGASGLLELRRQRGHAPNLPLDKVVRRQILRICILRGVTVPDLLRDGADYGEEGPMLELDSLMVRVATLRSKALILFHGINSSLLVHAQQLEDIAVEAQALDTALTSWSQALPEDWTFSSQPSPLNLDPLDADGVYNGPVHIYNTYGHASIWNRYRAIHLIVDSIGMRCLSNPYHCPSMGPRAVAQHDLYQRNTTLLANDLCGATLFFFNSPNTTGEGAGSKYIKIGTRVVSSDREILPKMAGLLAWPLAVAVSTESVPGPQRQWLRRRLKTVAESTVDAVLGSIVERGEFRF